MSFGISAATAAIVGGGLAAAGSVAGAVIGSKGAQSAAQTQANAQDQAAANQMAMFNTITGNEQPFMQAGQNATTSLQQLLGLTPGNAGNLQNGYLTQTMAPFNPADITSSPGYQFAQSQGAQQVLNADTPAVGALSGAALKDLTNFTTGTAAKYYNDYFNQYNTQFNQFQSQRNNIFDRLSGLAGLGQNAAGNVGNSGTQLGIGSAQAIAGAGASQAAGIVGGANALSSGISGGLNSAGSYLTLGNLLSNGGGAPQAYGTTASGNPIYFTSGS